ncbi:hypothetical protein [Ochrobactrum soli]|uniref:Uncharacterized protein n=1 Tax=Ochrobactrum soli TaxID=2448455 RepID=A0A849KLD2_9HYPH|nr:hypothetical protein [[Ochrobactrum] soli]NNU62461.1 hypothetical protein [[Ochrobactrum] soli]
MINTFQHIQIIRDFLRFVSPQVAAKLTVQLRRLPRRELDNGPRSIRLLPRVKMKCRHGIGSLFLCQTNKFGRECFKCFTEANSLAGGEGHGD